MLLLQAGPSLTTLTHAFAACGSYSIGAKALDDDGGVSPAFALAGGTVGVSDLEFQQPLDEGVDNLVQKGRIVPVKITVGCVGTPLSRLTPAIQLLKGDVSPGTETAADEVETYSASAADTGTTMRAVNGGYHYNLRVPDDAGAVPGAKYTIHVRPFGNTGSAPAEYVVLKIK